MAEAQSKGEMHFSHFGPEANLFEELETLFRVYGESGTGKARKYLHEEEEAAPYQQKAGTFTPWEDIPSDTDMLFYEGLHGAIVTETVNVAQHADLLIGVVPVINLEWVQKLHRDKMVRGYTQEAVVDTILRRMPDYINYICPQFSQTHVNFQRVPTVDTSNPFIARDVPSAGRKHAHHPFRRSEGHRLSLSAVDAARLVHVAAKHHRLPGREDAAGDAAHIHPDDLAADGAQAAGRGGRMTLLRWAGVSIFFEHDGRPAADPLGAWLVL